MMHFCIQRKEKSNIVDKIEFSKNCKEFKVGYFFIKFSIKYAFSLGLKIESDIYLLF